MSSEDPEITTEDIQQIQLFDHLENENQRRFLSAYCLVGRVRGERFPGIERSTGEVLPGIPA